MPALVDALADVAVRARLATSAWKSSGEQADPRRLQPSESRDREMVAVIKEAGIKFKPIVHLRLSRARHVRIWVALHADHLGDGPRPALSSDPYLRLCRHRGGSAGFVTGYTAPGRSNAVVRVLNGTATMSWRGLVAGRSPLSERIQEEM